MITYARGATPRATPAPDPVSGRPRRGRRIAIFSALTGTALVAAACSSGGTHTTHPTASAIPPIASAPAAPARAPAAARLLGTARTGVGQILVDGHGKAIYVFTADKLGRSVCVGGCLQFWPIVPAPAILPTQLTGITLGALARPDGGRQLTVDGSPVYTFARDTRPGSIAGQGRQLAGGRWWVLTPAGTPITAGGPVASPVPAPAPTTSAPPAAAVPAPAPAPMTPTPPAPAAGLPHNDGDADNNGGPNDGDGNI